MLNEEQYHLVGERRAYELGNRGRIRFDQNGRLEQDILDSYFKHGFYVFENVLGTGELQDLKNDLNDLLDHAPIAPKSEVDQYGNPARGTEFQIPTFRFGKPLSDPFGGTDANNGRHPAKMFEPTPDADAPNYTIYFVYGIFQVMDAFLRLYGHPKLLKVAEAVNGEDFAPFNDSIWIKEPGLGTSVAWHQDGTTHWNHPQWHENIHGFNFMAQLEDTNPVNSLWVVPGTHKQGKVDIKKMVDDAGTDQLPNAVPMLCKAGDIAICNRQALHGSFANTSKERRVSIVFGFHPRASVLGVTTSFGNNKTVHYDEARIHRRSRVIQLAIDAREQRFPNESRYEYLPLIDEIEENRWSETTRQTVLHDYNLYNLGI